MGETTAATLRSETPLDGDAGRATFRPTSPGRDHLYSDAAARCKFAGNTKSVATSPPPRSSARALSDRGKDRRGVTVNGTASATVFHVRQLDCVLDGRQRVLRPTSALMRLFETLLGRLVFAMRIPRICLVSRIGVLALAAGGLMSSSSATPQAPGSTVPPPTIGAAAESDSAATASRASRLARRTKILEGEAVGEQGARVWARSQGWTSISDGTDKLLRQGLDQVYRGSDGVIHAVEAKGNAGRVIDAYGYRQGSPEWAVRAAHRTLLSARASAAERLGAREVIRAARNGRLNVHVVRTVTGEGTAALESSAASNFAARRLADDAIDGLRRSGAWLRPVAVRSATRAGSGTLMSGRAVTRFAWPVAVVAEVAIRVPAYVETERQFGAGEISQEYRELVHARNAAGAVGGFAGAWAGAITGAAAVAKLGAAVGTGVAPGPGSGAGVGVGAIVGGIGGGIIGYYFGEQAAEAAAVSAVQAIHSCGTTLKKIGEEAWTITESFFDESRRRLSAICN